MRTGGGKEFMGSRTARCSRQVAIVVGSIRRRIAG